MAEGNGLLNRPVGKNPLRGFESRPLRFLCAIFTFSQSEAVTHCCVNVAVVLELAEESVRIITKKNTYSVCLLLPKIANARTAKSTTADRCLIAGGSIQPGRAAISKSTPTAI